MHLDWADIPGRAHELRALGPFQVGSERWTLVSERARLRLPPAVPAPPGLWDAPGYGEETVRERAARLARARRGEAERDPLDAWLAALPAALPPQCVLLMQAGAVALAWFEDGEPLQTKSAKRYVVRGTGHAQPTHLRTKGKSRYGARLRLQNAKRLRGETVERLADLWTERGAPAQLFVSAPKPLWADLLAARPAPPFDDRTEVVRIPYDVPIPTTEVLLDVYGRLRRAVVERSG